MATGVTACHLLFTGPPGVGKTTAARRVADIWRSSGHEVLGFYTEEVRSGGRRVGFDIVSLDGSRVALARTEPFADFPVSPSTPRVSAYLVNVPAFELAVEAALAPALSRLVGPLMAASPPPLVIVDEVGKMELLSASFRRLIVRLAEGAGRRPAPFLLLGTLPDVARAGARGDDPLVARLRSGDGGNFRLRCLTREDRVAAPGEAVAWLEGCCK